MIDSIERPLKKLKILKNKNFHSFSLLLFFYYFYKTFIDDCEVELTNSFFLKKKKFS